MLASGPRENAVRSLPQLASVFRLSASLYARKQRVVEARSYERRADRLAAQVHPPAPLLSNLSTPQYHDVVRRVMRPQRVRRRAR